MKITQVNAAFFSVESSQDTRAYDVVIPASQRASCTCLDWLFKRNKIRVADRVGFVSGVTSVPDCKHIAAVRAYKENSEVTVNREAIDVVRKKPTVQPPVETIIVKDQGGGYGKFTISDWSGDLDWVRFQFPNGNELFLHALEVQELGRALIELADTNLDRRRA